MPLEEVGFIHFYGILSFFYGRLIKKKKKKEDENKKKRIHLSTKQIGRPRLDNINQVSIRYNNQLLEINRLLAGLTKAKRTTLENGIGKFLFYHHHCCLP